MVKKNSYLLIIVLFFGTVACDGLEDIINKDLPKIDGGLSVSKTSCLPMDTILASVNATNPIDGDLEYEWKVSPNAGKFEPLPDPSMTRWVAPSQSGDYTLSVKVKNDEGSKEVSKTIEVMEPQQPILNGGIVLSAAEVTVGDTLTASISATNPREGPLTYEWTSDRGNCLYPKDNDTVLWVAPVSGGECTITVEVSNDLSSIQTSKNVNVVSSSVPVVNISAPQANTYFYIGDKILVDAQAYHDNGISAVRLYVQVHAGQDSLIETLESDDDESYNFTKLKANSDLVGNAVIKVEAEAKNQLQTKGSDQVTIKVLGIHVGKR
jgi:hypothetical protein